MYKFEKNTKLHITYVETIVKASLLDVILILRDVEQYKKWVSVVSTSQILGEVSPFRKLSCIRADLPRPFAKR